MIHRSFPLPGVDEALVDLRAALTPHHLALDAVTSLA
jgi:hypothetical protein